MSSAGVLRPSVARVSGNAPVRAGASAVEVSRRGLPVFVALAAVQTALVWLLPRTAPSGFCLLGATLVLFVAGALPAWHPRRTVALVALTALVAAAALLTAPAALPVARLTGAVVQLVAVAAVSLAAALRGHRAAGRALLAAARLEREQENARARSGRPEQLASQDALTGLVTRRSWDGELGRACERARRDGTPVAVLLVDLDRFKAVNDRHGHPAGDVVLRQVADLLASTVRHCDVVARLGGDELSVLLPDTTVARAVLLAERLRARTAELQPTGFCPGEVTISIGVAGAAGSQAFPLELMARADQQLFRAKIDRNSVAAPGTGAGVPTPRAPSEPLRTGT